MLQKVNRLKNYNHPENNLNYNTHPSCDDQGRRNKALHHLVQTGGPLCSRSIGDNIFEWLIGCGFGVSNNAASASLLNWQGLVTVQLQLLTALVQLGHMVSK